jgi:hypothetical protein
MLYALATNPGRLPANPRSRFALATQHLNKTRF